MAETKDLFNWFDTGYVYIDPNDHFPFGYAMINCLLLLYKKVIIHSPYAGRLQLAESNLPNELQLLLPEWSDLQSLVCDEDPDGTTPPLQITAFPTYTDPSYDKMRNCGYKAIQQVDSDRLDDTSSFYKALIIVDRPHEKHANIAIEMAKNPDARSKATSLIADGNLPTKYDDAINDHEGFRPPTEMSSFWPRASKEEKLVALATFDYLNDRFVLLKGGGDVYCFTVAGEFAAELLFGIKDLPFKYSDMNNPPVQYELVREIIRTMASDETPRIDAKFIRDFRKRDRVGFIQDISKILADEEILNEPDSRARKRLASEKAKEVAKLDRFPFIFANALSYAVIMPATLGLSKVFLPKLEDYIAITLPPHDKSRKRTYRYAFRKRVRYPWSVDE